MSAPCLRRLGLRAADRGLIAVRRAAHPSLRDDPFERKGERWGAATELWQTTLQQFGFSERRNVDVAKAMATQLANIEKRTGKSLAELAALVKKSGLEKHGELVAMLKRDLDMGHGDANTLVHHVKNAGAASPTAASPDAALAAIYAGPKAALQPIHDALMKEIGKFGDFEVAPKKAYKSLRRKKQFATIGPATKTEVEIGLNSKTLKAGGRIVKLPPGGMCQFKARIATSGEADKALIAAIRQAYDEAG